MSLIEAHDLIKTFGTKKVLRGINFVANKGEIIALLGPNGAGKSTFLRILAGLLKPTSGQIKISGRSLSSNAVEIKKEIGLVTHVPLVYGDLTVEENLKFFGNLFFIDNVSTRVTQVIKLIDLTALRSERVGNLSRGMQQRVSIGRAILHDPQILLLDEPNTGLDQESIRRLDVLLLELSTSGRVIVMTSHDISHVEEVANRFDLLRNGVIIRTIEKKHLDKGLQDIYREALL